MDVKDVLVDWRRRLKRRCILGIWKLVPLTMWWCSWKARSRWIFEGKALSHQNFTLFFLRMLYSWSQVLDCCTKVPLLDFVDKIIHKSLRA